MRLIFPRLKGWLFRRLKMRSNSYRPSCLRCRQAKNKEHRPCFHPYCYCWCSRFHGVYFRDDPDKPKKPDTPKKDEQLPGWGGLLVSK